jgi:GTP-binding protein Era
MSASPDPDVESRVDEADEAIDAREAFRTGMVAIIGRPNVGKSTLLNRLVGQKISITSRKAQTTRHRILGIATTPTAQFVFVDTPGFQTRHKSLLHKSMHRAIRDAISGVACVLFVVEAGRFGPDDEAVLTMLPDDTPVILVINKTDATGDKSMLLPFIAARAGQHPWAAIVPVSAKTGLQITELQTEIEKLLPPGMPLFDADDLTDRSERFLVSEMIREKVFRQLGDELPYGMTVVIDRFIEEPSKEDGGRFCRIAATIVVERASHKAMLIGAGGGKLKLIGSEARADIEQLLQSRCHLELWVKVRAGWADSAALVKSFGYD